MKVEISLDGCDDSTTIPMEVTKEEFKFLQRLSELSYKCSDSQCKPDLSVIDVDIDKKENEWHE